MSFTKEDLQLQLTDYRARINQVYVTLHQLEGAAAAVQEQLHTLMKRESEQEKVKEEELKLAQVNADAP